MMVKKTRYTHIHKHTLTGIVIVASLHVFSATVAGDTNYASHLKKAGNIVIITIRRWTLIRVNKYTLIDLFMHFSSVRA